MTWHPPATLAALVLCTSCTTLLGVEEGILDDTGATSSTGSSSATGASTTGAAASTGDGPSSSSAGGGGSSTVATASSAGGTAGDGGGGGGGTGDGGAATVGSTGAGGDGGAATTATTGPGGGGGTGGGGSCPLAEIAPCPGVQPTSFTVASDLADHWDVLSAQAEVNVADQLALRVPNGSTAARVQAKVPLAQPTSCGVWVALVLPSSGASVASGLALVGATGTHAVYRLEGELRVRDAAGGIEAIPYDAVDTAMIRARFDAAGDLWLDTSPDGACWTAVDGPFSVGEAPIDVQIFVERPGSAGSTSSTFDDYTL